MIWRDYQLGDTISKTSENITLWQTEKGIIKIGKETLALPIELNDQRKGYIFHGHGKLVLDTIVETEKGAIGKSVEKEINDPFLMLGDTKEPQQSLTTATDEDLAERGYENRREFVTKAEDLLDQFLKDRMHRRRCSDEDYGFIFAFLNQRDQLDILVAKDSKLVYKAMDIVFVSNRNNVVLKSSSGVVCTNNGKSVIIKNGKSFIIQK